MELNNILAGFEERMKNISVFSPILNLNSKTKFKDLHLVSLGLATLLYILENMLLNKPTTTEGLNHFLQELLSEKFDTYMNYDDIDQLRSILVDKFLRNDGSKHEFEYYDFTECQVKTYLFDLIEYENYNINEWKEKKIRLQLSPQGIEMLFKTKELYSELQISITQLYFKQQMQKGLFNEALKAVDDLSLAIQNEKKKMRELQSDMIKDAITVSKKNRLEKQLESANDKMQMEKEVFQDLKSVVDKALDSYYKGELSEKEEDGIDMILLIQKRLLGVIHLHESLFTEKQKLQMVMSNSIEALIVNAFSVKMNFEKEVLAEVVNQQSSLDTIHKIVNPILPVKKFTFFHPGQAFEEQRRKIRKIEDDETLPEITEEELLKIEEDEKQKEIEKENKEYRFLKLIIKPLIDKESIKISEVLNELKISDRPFYDEIKNDVSFYSFLVTVHQSEYTSFEKISPEYFPHVTMLSRNLSKLTEEYPEFEEFEFFSLYPTKEIVQFENGYVLTDFIIQRGNLYALARK